MSKDRLLSDEELKENIITFLLGEKYKNKYGLLSDTEKHHVDYLIDLINTQKRLAVEKVRQELTNE